MSREAPHPQPSAGSQTGGPDRGSFPRGSTAATKHSSSAPNAGNIILFFLLILNTRFLLTCWITTPSKVDKLSHHPQRQPPPNHWSWYQNVRLPAPPGPPPPTRTIHGGSSPSQAPPSLVQPGRRYGNSHPNPRSPPASMIQSPGYGASQVIWWMYICTVSPEIIHAPWRSFQICQCENKQPLKGDS